MSTKKKRRYPKAKFPIYDHAYKEAEENSPVLQKTKQHIGNQYLRNSPEAALLELEGDPGKDNFHNLKGDWQLAIIPAKEKELKQIHSRFQRWAEEQVKSGQSLEKPDKWPDALLELRLKKEAILDVHKAEAKKIREYLEAIKAEKEAKRVANLLPNGPVAIRDGKSPREQEQLNSIDGQKLSENLDGIPYIDEPESPYHLMSLFHYKKMSKSWMKEMGLDKESLFKEREREYKEARIEAEMNDKALPMNRMPIKRFRKEKLSKITDKDFPDWPEDVKPIEDFEFVE